MRVALDSTSLIGARTGVGTFTAEILARLARHPEVDLTAFAVTRRGAGAMASALPEGVAAVGRPMVARPLRWCWMRADHPTIETWTGTIDVVHGPNFVVPPARRAAEVVTVHDLTCVRFPEMCTRDVLQVPDLLRRALARGAWVHTVSEFVAAEDSDLMLVLAGPDGWGAEAVTAAIGAARHGDRVRRLGWVDDPDREALLAGAAVVAYPSIYEGFGLPPLEALAAGTPVVATRAGALPEVLQGAAEWADVGDPAGLAAALRTVLDEPDRAEALVRAGAGRVAAYSWDSTAEALVELYRRAAAAR